MARRRLLYSTFLLSSLIFVLGCSGGRSATEGERQSSSDSPIVATYGDSTLTLSEFERAYVEANNVNAQKNRTPANDSLAAYQEFLEQYVNFRLKVQAAREAGLDTLASVQHEIRSYRQKMGRPRVMRSQIYEPLIRSLYERRKQEVDVSHILIRVAPDAAPADTLEAYQKIAAIADSVERGVPFGDLAYRNSEDPSARKKGRRGYRGHIGYVRAGQIVEPFEDRMYSLPPDSVSDVFRTRFGYHVLKVHDRRPADPPIRLSHIMIRPQGDSAGVRALLDSLRTEIVEKGADFGAVAKQYSEDSRSASRGGDLGTVETTQSLPPSFRRAVTRLDTVGAVSDVVRSRFGYHLIELTDREAPPSFEEAYEELKDAISDRPRVDQRMSAFAHRIREEEGVTVDTSSILQEANVPTVDTLAQTLLPPAPTGPQAPASPTVVTLGDSTYTLRQLARHVMQTDGGAQGTIGDVIEDFLNEKSFRYAAARLEERDPSFASTMTKYREGLLVFEFMQDSVWTVARTDTAGLRQTYQERRDQYRYPDRVRTVVLRAPADSLLSPYQTAYEDTTTLAEIVQQAKSDSLVTVDTAMVTDRSPEVYRQMLSVNDGTANGPIKHDGKALFLVRDRLLPARPKTFEEARSSVIRDHQKRYEDAVLSRLRRRYNVETYPNRLRQAFDDRQPTASSTP